MNGDRAIFLSLIMNTDTKSTSRNVEEKVLAIDLTDNEDFTNIDIKLAANNQEGTNPKAVKEITNIESFFYLYSPYEAELTLISVNDTEITLNVVDITLLRSAFKKVIIKNKNSSDILAVKTIYS